MCCEEGSSKHINDRVGKLSQRDRVLDSDFRPNDGSASQRRRHDGEQQLRWNRDHSEA